MLRSAPRLPFSASPNCVASSPRTNPAIQAPAGGIQPILDQLAKREALEQRDDVGEALVERRHVGVGVLDVALVNRVENRVRRLVGDDVGAQTGEDQPAGIVRALELIGGGEVAEQEGHLVGIVIGVGVAKRVRMDAKPLDVFARHCRSVHVGLALRPHQARIPHDPAAQRALEVADRLHRHGVDELLMKLRVAFARRQPLLRGDLLVATGPPARTSSRSPDRSRSTSMYSPTGPGSRDSKGTR